MPVSPKWSFDGYEMFSFKAKWPRPIGLIRIVALIWTNYISIRHMFSTHVNKLAFLGP